MKKERSSWEDLCHCCGLCCYEKERDESGAWVLNLERPCPWLDEETRLCRIYENRLKVYPRCRKVTRRMALFAPYLPPTCGYVTALRPSWLPQPQICITMGSVDEHGRESD